MTAEAFVAWSEARGGDTRYELLDGDIVAMASERAVHARVKGNIYVQLRTAISTSGLGCEAFMDGMAVRIDATTVFEPDAMVRCGPRLEDDIVLVEDPIIVFEVASPSTQRIDVLTKFRRYFSCGTIRHYLIVVPTSRTVIHHYRRTDGGIETNGLDRGTIVLDPPGLAFDIDDLFRSDA